MNSWFSMDCNIYTNPKVLQFAKEAKLDVDTAVGKLGRLYAWAAQCGNEDGDITFLPPQELAEIMRWKKKPADLVGILVSVGLLDQMEVGALVIHAWDERNGAFLRNRRKDRERKK